MVKELLSNMIQQLIEQDIYINQSETTEGISIKWQSFNLSFASPQTLELLGELLNFGLDVFELSLITEKKVSKDTIVLCCPSHSNNALSQFLNGINIAPILPEMKILIRLNQKNMYMLLSEAKDAYKNKHLDQCISLHEEIIKEKPHDSNSYHNAACMYHIKAQQTQEKSLLEKTKQYYERVLSGFRKYKSSQDNFI